MSILVILLIVSLVLAGFAAASETALTSVSRLRIRSLADEGDRRAAVVVKLHNQPNAYLSTILSVNTVAVIVASREDVAVIDLVSEEAAAAALAEAASAAQAALAREAERLPTQLPVQDGLQTGPAFG